MLHINTNSSQQSKPVSPDAANSNPNVKPPYSYIALITMAIIENFSIKNHKFFIQNL